MATSEMAVKTWTVCSAILVLLLGECTAQRSHVDPSIRFLLTIPRQNRLTFIEPLSHTVEASLTCATIDVSACNDEDADPSLIESFTVLLTGVCLPTEECTQREVEEAMDWIQQLETLYPRQIGVILERTSKSNRAASHDLVKPRRTRQNQLEQPGERETEEEFGGEPFGDSPDETRSLLEPDTEAITLDDTDEYGPPQTKSTISLEESANLSPVEPDVFQLEDYGPPKFNSIIENTELELKFPVIADLETIVPESSSEEVDDVCDCNCTPTSLSQSPIGSSEPVIISSQESNEDISSQAPNEEDISIQAPNEGISSQVPTAEDVSSKEPIEVIFSQVAISSQSETGDVSSKLTTGLGQKDSKIGRWIPILRPGEVGKRK